MGSRGNKGTRTSRKNSSKTGTTNARIKKSKLDELNGMTPHYNKRK
jgi:hypothetical protein